MTKHRKAVENSSKHTFLRTFVLLEVLSRRAPRVAHAPPSLEHVKERGVVVVLQQLDEVVPAAC